MNLSPSLSPPSLPAPPAGSRLAPASPAQEQRCFLDQLHPGRPHNNLPLALGLDGPLDAALLARALNDVVARHDIFRTYFDFASGHPVQVIAPALNVPVPVVDLRLLPAGTREAQAFRLAR
ncbi:MAG: Malonyl CoA-acyl carrier protein transacylase, partial [Lacunisphaera sp.]|nr:Malonyl CoA-acyl carrier protein transacylase [Lacunisphaera sp.]